MSAIQIGSIIYNNIITDAELYQALGNKVYPIQAPQNTTFPFVVYSRVNTYVETSTKDGYLNDATSFQITVVSDKYNESAYLADKVREAFEGCNITFNDMVVTDIRLTSCSESLVEDEYIQNLNFDCEVEY